MTIETYPNIETWRHKGRFYLGASENRILCGEGYATESVLGLWAWKTRGIETQHGKMTEEAMRVGRIMEKALAELFFDLHPELFSEQHGGETIVRHIHEEGLLAATIDRFVDDDGDRGVLELKNVGNHDAWQWGEGPPLRVNCQVQQQMMCTGCDYGWAFALIGGNRRVAYRIEPNYKFQEAILEKAKEFWMYVENDEEPPADFAPAATRILTQLHPYDSGETVYCDDDELLLYARNLKEARDNKKTNEGIEENAKTKLMQALGDATYLEFPDGSVVSWKTQEAKMPAREAYTKTSRVMRVKLAKEVEAV